MLASRIIENPFVNALGMYLGIQLQNYFAAENLLEANEDELMC
jgi:hypothetical protein